MDVAERTFVGRPSAQFFVLLPAVVVVMAGGPRLLGPIDKAADEPTGIGLQLDDEGRQKHCMVAYVKDDSLWVGILKKGDEVLEVNGVKVTDPKQASDAIVAAAPQLMLLVYSTTITHMLV